MAAQQITESEVRRLTQELEAKDAELKAKDVELRELKEERSAMLLLYVREFTELQKWQASTTKMLEASAVLLQKEGDMIGGQASRLERERAIVTRSRIASATWWTKLPRTCCGCAMPTVVPARPCRPSG